MHAVFRFYGPLNDFLPAERRQRDFRHEFRDRASIKDMIESLGVPHPEVEVILVDGEPVDFGHRVAAGERISAYPHLHAFGRDVRLRAGEPAPVPPRFVLDAHLRRLAVYLRLLGLDTRWWPGAEDADLASVAADEDRILLTRDLGLLKRSAVRHGRFVRARKPRKQLAEIVERYDLPDHARPFSRCVRCNGVVVDVAKQDVLHRLEENTKRFYDRFRHCPDCDRLFWRGSHYTRMRWIVEAVLPGWRDPRDTQVSRA